MILTLIFSSIILIAVIIIIACSKITLYFCEKRKHKLCINCKYHLSRLSEKYFTENLCSNPIHYTYKIDVVTGRKNKYFLGEQRADDYMIDCRMARQYFHYQKTCTLKAKYFEEKEKK